MKGQRADKLTFFVYNVINNMLFYLITVTFVLRNQKLAYQMNTLSLKLYRLCQKNIQLYCLFLRSLKMTATQKK